MHRHNMSHGVWMPSEEQSAHCARAIEIHSPQNCRPREAKAEVRDEGVDDVGGQHRRLRVADVHTLQESMQQIFTGCL